MRQLQLLMVRIRLIKWKEERQKKENRADAIHDVAHGSAIA